MKRASSQQNNNNQQINQLCYDMDSMQLRSQTSVAGEDCRNSLDEMDKIMNESPETQIDNDDNSFTDEIDNFAFSSAVYAKKNRQSMGQPMFTQSITINQVYENQKRISEPEEPRVEANLRQEEPKKVLNQFDDIESVSSSIIRLPKNQSKIKITAIQFKTYEEIETSLDLQSNYFRKVNENQNMIRTNMKFMRMNGADIVRERSKCKNPRPSSGNAKQNQSKFL